MDDGGITWSKAGMLSKDGLELGHQIMAGLKDLLV